MSKEINFWAQSDKYGCFSNFYPCKIKASDDLEFNCTEQYFMYAKAQTFKDEETMGKILQETNPMKIKKLGREIKNYDDKVWAPIRYNIMKTGNLLKYNQNPELAKILLDTGDAIIIEDSPYDYIWGIGKERTGQNLLGKVLMEVREHLIEVREHPNLDKK